MGSPAAATPACSNTRTPARSTRPKRRTCMSFPPLRKRPGGNRRVTFAHVTIQHEGRPSGAPVPARGRLSLDLADLDDAPFDFGSDGAVFHQVLDEHFLHGTELLQDRLVQHLIAVAASRKEAVGCHDELGVGIDGLALVPHFHDAAARRLGAVEYVSESADVRETAP